MSGPGANPYAANRHADVMHEEPTDDAAKMRLVGEVKNRAKGAFQQKDMMSAEMLYGRAISLLETMPDKREATLYSNRAMVRLNLNKDAEALADCKKCIELDATNIKAWHRQAQALLRLGEFDDAMAACVHGGELDPANKAFPELMEKAEKDKAKDAEDKARLKRDAQDVRVELHNASTARAPPKAPKEKKDGEPAEDLGMRGYKKTADGKTTSYFHTDITPEAKALLEASGAGKPARLDADAAAMDVDVAGGGSQWNQAGTYEEKNMLPWAKTRLAAILTGVTFSVPAGSGGTIAISGVQDVTGDASISVSRGKRRYIMDLSFTIDFNVQCGETSGKGTVTVAELTSMADEEPELKAQPTADTPPAAREIIDAFAKPAGQGLQPLIRDALATFVAEYTKQ